MQEEFRRNLPHSEVETVDMYLSNMSISPDKLLSSPATSSSRLMPLNPGSTSCEGLEKLRSVVVLDNDGHA